MGVISLFNTLKTAGEYKGDIEAFQVDLRDETKRKELYKYVSDPSFGGIFDLDGNQETVPNTFKEFELNYYSTEADSPYTTVDGSVFDIKSTPKIGEVNTNVFDFSKGNAPVLLKKNEQFDLFNRLTTVVEDKDQNQSISINKDLFNLDDESLANQIELMFPGFTAEALTYSNNGESWKNSVGSKSAYFEQKLFTYGPNIGKPNPLANRAGNSENNAVKIIAPDGTYTVIEASILDNRENAFKDSDAKPSYYKEDNEFSPQFSINEKIEKAYLQSYNDLTSFVNSKLKDVDTEKALKDKIERRNIVSQYQEVITPDENKIKEQFNNVDLFTPVDAYGKIEGYQGAFKIKKQPYEEELQTVFEMLTKKNKEQPSTELLHKETRRYLINEKVQKEKYNNIINFQEYAEDGIFPLVFKSYEDDPSKLTAIINLGTEEFQKEYIVKKELLETAIYYQSESPVAVSYNKTRKNLEDPSYEYDIKEGDEILTLSDGRNIPLTVYNKFKQNQILLNESVESSILLRNDILDNLGDLSDADLILNLIGRDYNDWNKFGASTVIAYTNMFGGNQMGLTTESQEGLASYQKQRNVINRRLNKYAPNIEFDDAFGNGWSNFGKFVSQEISNQLPVFTALAIPKVGWGILLTSSAGEQYGNMSLEEAGSMGLVDYSTWEKTYTSAGYAIPEAVFERLTTVPLLRGAGNSLKGLYGTSIRDLTFNGVKNGFKETGPVWFRGAALGTGGEGATQISQNLVTGKPWHQDLSHALFSGFMFETTLASVPVIKGVVVASLSDYNKTETIRKDIEQKDKLIVINKNLDLRINHPSLKSDRVETSLLQEKAANQAEIDRLNSDIDIAIQEDIKSVQGMSTGAFQGYTEVTKEQEQLRVEAISVKNNKNLSAEQRQKRLEKLKLEFDKKQFARNMFKKEKYSAFHGWAGQNKNSKEYQKIREQAEKELLQGGAKTGITKEDASELEIYQKSKQIWNTKQINKNIAKAKKDGFFTNEDLEVFQTVEDFEKASKEKNKDGNLKNKDLEKALESVNNGSHGFDVGSKSYIVVENMAKDDRLETKTHELSHRLWTELIGRNEQAFKPLAQTVLKWAEQNDKGLFFRLNRTVERSKSGVMKADEVLAVFLEEAAAGNVNLNQENIGGVFGFFSSKVLKDEHGIDIDLGGKTDAISMLVGLGKKLKAGTLTIKDVKALESRKDIQEAKIVNKVVDIVSQETDIKQSAKAPKVNSTTRVNQIGLLDPKSKRSFEKKGGNERWKSYGYREAVRIIEKEGLLDGLILSKYKVDKVPANFIKDTLTELTPHIRNYKPERKNENGLFGWINPQIKNKAAQAYNKISKVKPELQGPRIGDVNKEGDPNIQIASEDTGFESIEEKDMSISAQIAENKRIKAGEVEVDEVVEGQRILKQLNDININNADVVSQGVYNKLEQLIIKNPKDLDQQIQKLIYKPFLKEIQKSMGGTIGVNGPSVEYKSFIVNGYKRILDSFSVELIKNRYGKGKNPLFNVKKTSREKDKKVNPETGVITYPGKGVYSINTSLDQFQSFFLEGGMTTLRDKQSKLAGLIADSMIDKASSDYIENNSKNEKAIAEIIIKRAANQENTQVKENNNFDDIKYSQKKARADLSSGLFLYEEIKKKGGVEGIYEVKNGKPRLVGKYKNKKIPIYMQEFIYNDVFAAGLATDVKIGDTVQKMLQAVGKKYKNTNNGVVYEQYSIDVANQTEGINVLTKKVAEGGIPDIHAELFGFDFFVEIKLASAQYGSITISDYNVFKGKWKYTKNYKFDKEIDTLVESQRTKLVEAFNWMNDQKFLLDDGSVFVHDGMMGTIIPTPLLKAAGMGNSKAGAKASNGKTYYANMQISGVEFDIDNIGEMYHAKKDYPVDLIGVQGKGLQHFGENNLSLNIPRFGYDLKGNKIGKATITLRRAPNTVKRVAKLEDLNNPLYSNELKGTIFKNGKDGDKKSIAMRENSSAGWTRLSYRAFPIADASTLVRSTHSLGNILEAKEFVNSPEVQALKNLNEFKNSKRINNAINIGRLAPKNIRGITILDFDDTLATSKSLIKYTKPDGTKGTLTPEQYASTYQDLQDFGYEFDFSDFNKVVDGKVAPLFQKALKLQEKFGNKDMFVLTARPAESAPAIFTFLKANGLNIPLKNITGLANSTSEAKALWVADKVAKGYNDFYFADDALQNVQAVDNMLNQFDVKRKVQRAKIKFSNSMNNEFNDILETITGIESKKRFAATKARKRGASKGKFRLFIPPSHEDFVGLLYNFMGKGKEGDAHRDFFEQSLVRPLNRANKEYDTARQSIATDYKNLNKEAKDVKKMHTQSTPDGDFTYQDAIRIYLWDKHGYKIPGLSPIDQKKLVNLVKSNTKLLNYAEKINVISKQETYVSPTEGWDSGDIRMDLDDATGRVGRAGFFKEFNKNADIIFSVENLNKIQAAYGLGVREALEDMLYRVKTGRNRPSGQNKIVNSFMNYLNGSVGSVMFFNIRSVVLQQMSIVNYINFADNNVYAAAKAFANQKQYWSDWAFIFNSDMLKQRRGGIQTDINGAELAASIRSSKNPSRFLISKLLQLGFAPTQIADNIAIATGGATYYRNRINTYLKQGLSQKEAEAKAFTDFQDITQSTQQSARPDMVSQQQASAIGKVILNFQNVTSQFNRLGKKAFQDIYNRRTTKPNTSLMQSDISNAARITYYFAIQNLIFYSLQTALFSMMFDDDEDDNNKLFLKKKERLINGSIDSVLRGSGFLGAVLATLKNVGIAFARQRDVDYNPDESAVLMEALNLSPVVGIKARKIVNAEKTLNYNKNAMKELETFDIDNPHWSAITNYIEAGTNLPLNRLYNKTMNVRQSLNSDHANWQRTLMFLGWSQYNLGIMNDKVKEANKAGKQKSKRAF